MNKTCSVCESYLPASEFGVLVRNKDGLAGRCKPCARNAVAQSKRKHPETVRNANKTEAAKARIARFKSANPDFLAKFYAKHRDRILEKSRADRSANAEKYRATSNARYRAKANAKREAMAEILQGPKMPSAIKARRDRADWKVANQHLVNANTQARRFAKRNATPAWRNKFFISEAYHLAKLRSELTGVKHEVDHIYPLKSAVVCGLHVEFNLQVIPAKINRLKGNTVSNHA